jgi:hypothetical protein
VKAGWQYLCCNWFHAGTSPDLPEDHVTDDVKFQSLPSREHFVVAKVLFAIAAKALLILFKT